MSQIADLLQAARDAHARFHAQGGSIGPDGRPARSANLSQRRIEAQAALNARKRAHSLDSTWSDPAWDEDCALNRDVESADIVRFFEEYLRTH